MNFAIQSLALNRLRQFDSVKTLRSHVIRVKLSSSHLVLDILAETIWKWRNLLKRAPMT